MDEMNEDEIKDFLEEKNLAILGTIGKNGIPHITPVWFSYDGSHVYVTTTDGSVKIKNIENDKRISILVSTLVGDRVVIMEGTAEMYEDNQGHRTKYMTERYIQDPQQRKDMINWLMREKRITIKITPNKTTSWYMKKN